MKTTILAVFWVCLTIVFGNAQTLSITNGNSVLTVSNGTVIATQTISAPAPVLVSTNGQVVPQAFIDAIAQATDIPEGVLKVVPLKGLVWLFVLAVGVPVASRWLRKLIPDDLQTGNAGRVLQHMALEINPQLTPTPPDVAAPKTILAVQETGQKVVAEPAATVKL